MASDFGLGRLLVWYKPDFGLLCLHCFGFVPFWDEAGIDESDLSIFCYYSESIFWLSNFTNLTKLPFGGNNITMPFVNYS